MGALEEDVAVTFDAELQRVQRRERGGGCTLLGLSPGPAIATGGGEGMRDSWRAGEVVGRHVAARWRIGVAKRGACAEVGSSGPLPTLAEWDGDQEDEKEAARVTWHASSASLHPEGKYTLYCLPRVLCSFTPPGRLPQLCSVQCIL